MDLFNERQMMPTRRQFLGSSSAGLAAFSSLLAAEGAVPPLLSRTAPRAKRIIYLFQSGGTSQIDLFDPKPQLARFLADRISPTRFAAASG
jgi:hypothetical protein